MSPKITIIGAGSAVFSLSLIKDLCLTPSLKGSTVTLMDISAERLENAYTLCTRYAEEAGTTLKVEKTTNRRQAIDGADFVINSALATGPGHDRLRKGWDVAYRHGYHFGGSLHIVHDEAFWINFYQMRLMESILQEMLEVNPSAWYIMVANPVMAGVTYLSRKYPQAKIVGMCHGYAGVYRVAEALGLEKGEIAYEIPGVNHFVWLNRFTHQERDALPLLEEWVSSRSTEYFEQCRMCDPLGPKAVDLYRRFGVFPIGDTGNPGGGSWGYWYHKDRETESRWKEDPLQWYQRYFDGGIAKVEHIGAVANDRARKVMEAFPGTQSDEPMVPLIDALAGNEERTIIVNIPNTGGFVEGVPEDFEVEVPATVNGEGIAGRKTHPLPAAVMQFLVRDRVVPVELELLAFETGKREYLLEMILTDPWTNDGDQATALLDEILALPFNREMREHFGG